MRTLPSVPRTDRDPHQCRNRSRAVVHRVTRPVSAVPADRMTGCRRSGSDLRRWPLVATITKVDNPDDSRIDDYRDLTHADRRPDRPGGRGLVIAEGVVVVRRLLDSPYPLR